MAQDSFAGSHTKTKLDAIEDYLRAYVTALRNQNFHLVYFDAFAGTGSIPHADEEAQTSFEIFDADEVVKGSVARALDLPSPFDEYIFVEKDKNKFSELKVACSKYVDQNVIRFRCEDANEAIRKFVAQYDWRKTRAVVFLDPFGNQISMDTLKVLASRPGIDVWYLFPSGLGVNRQIGNDGRVNPEHGASLDYLFGDDLWREKLLVEVENRDLFGFVEKKTIKNAGAIKITEYMLERLQETFSGRVLTDWLPLGKGRHHYYSLLFMWSNPSPKAARLARTLAKAVLRKGKSRGRTK